MKSLKLHPLNIKIKDETSKSGILLKTQRYLNCPERLVKAET